MMTKIGKYTILDILGKGAMGIVYRALDPDIDREVAIKAIHFDGVRESSQREELIKRFLREGQASGKLNQPNIVTIYDVGREGDLTYIVMQYIKGQSLQRILDSGRTYETNEVQRLMVPLLRAVDYAHKNGVVHRDIKPGNILVDKSGTPYLADFGLAKTAASTLTISGTAFGTPGYISPEQLQGQAADVRSDVFSLGVLLYVLLTGREPFGRKIETVMHNIVHVEPPPPSSIKPDLPAGYDVVVGRAMAKNPKGRYQSCAEMTSALESLDKSGASTLSFGIPGSTRDKPKKGKGKLIAGAAASAVVILAALSLVFIFKVFDKSGPAPQGRAAKPAVITGSTDLTGPKPDPIVSKLTAIRESFARNDFKGTKRLAEELLKEAPSQPEAQDLLSKAEQKLGEAETARLLGEASKFYENKDYDQCLKALGQVLQADPQNSEALRLSGQAESSLALAQIGRVVERQRRAEEEKDLVILLSDVSSPEAAGQRKEEALLLFNFYDGIKSSVSDVNYRLLDKTHAQVRFLHVVTGLYKKTNEKKVLVQDVQSWFFEKKGGSWKISGFQPESLPGA